jgi:hypothetical protein
VRTAVDEQSDLFAPLIVEKRVTTKKWWKKHESIHTP